MTCRRRTRLITMGLGRHAGACSSRALCSSARPRGPRGPPFDSDYRQPKCQSRAKRGSALDPEGCRHEVTGRKRHILVDTLGLLLSVAVHPANLHDREGARLSRSTNATLISIYRTVRRPVSPVDRSRGIPGSVQPRLINSRPRFRGRAATLLFYS